DHPPTDARIAVSRALPAAATPVGEATTPARAASRAALVSRLSVIHARLSSTPVKITKSKIGRMSTNSRLATPRSSLVCLRRLNVVMCDIRSGSASRSPTIRLHMSRLRPGRVHLSLQLRTDRSNRGRERALKLRREREHDRRHHHGAEDDPLDGDHPALVAKRLQQNAEHREHREHWFSPLSRWSLLLLYTTLSGVCIRLAVKRHHVRESFELQREHRVREPLLRYANNDGGRPVQSPPRIDDRHRDTERFERLFDARDSLLGPIGLDQDEGLHLVSGVCHR